MPCGFYIRRKKETNYMKEYASPTSKPATEWLTHLETSLGISIQHGRNGAEARIGPKRRSVDGICWYVMLYIGVVSPVGELTVVS